MFNFLNPKSIAIIGMSATKADLCKPVVDNLDRHGFNGKLFLVGRGGGTYHNREIHQSIGSIPEKPDLAVLLIPSHTIPSAIEECGRKGIRRIVIESGGFSESSEERKRLEKDILETARKWKVRLLGPNCLGIINTDNALVLPFAPLDPSAIRKGPVSIISQSGGIIINCIKLLAAENIGIGKIISIGNKLDLTENDFLDFLISDQDTKIIALYLESISDGRTLMTLAARTAKPIIVLKSNIASDSRKIAQFHTTALAGDDTVADAAFRQAGIHRVKNLLELANKIKAFSLPLIKGPQLAVLCRSGGQAVLSADAAHRYGFKLAAFPDRLIQMVKDSGRSGVIQLTNPLDLGDIFDFDRYIDIMSEALRLGNVDGLLLAHVMSSEDIDSTKRIIFSAQSLSEKYDKPVLVSFVSDPDQCLSLKKTADFPIFTDPDEALHALLSSCLHFRFLSARDGKRIKRAKAKTPEPQIKSAKPAPPEYVYKLLQEYGIPVADHSVVRDIGQALIAAEKIGYPVALKTASSSVTHKTESGRVRLNIPNKAALKRSFRTMAEEEYLIQEMIPGGWELFLGARQDPEFGPVVLCGMGGIFVEVLRDIVIRVAPFDRRTAEELIGELRGREILDGFRGQPPADANALISCLVNLSRLIAECRLVCTVDINPLILGEKGKGSVAVDAKMEVLEEA